MRDQQERTRKTNQHALKRFDGAHIEMIRRFIEHEEAGIRNKLLREHEFAELSRTQIVSIEQFIGVGIQPRHNLEDATLRLLVLTS